MRLAGGAWTALGILFGCSVVVGAVVLVMSNPVSQVWSRRILL